MIIFQKGRTEASDHVTASMHITEHRIPFELPSLPSVALEKL